MSTALYPAKSWLRKIKRIRSLERAQPLRANESAFLYKDDLACMLKMDATQAANRCSGAGGDQL